MRSSAWRLGAHKYTPVRQLGAYGGGGAQALVAVGRWHPDVGDDHVGSVSPRLLQHLVGFAWLADHRETGRLEHAHDAGAQEEGVLGDDDAQR
jgi:hypothetical protein